MQICFDALQRAHTFALEIATTRFGKQWLSHKTILDAQRLTHRCLQIFLNLGGDGHAKKI